MATIRREVSGADAVRRRRQVLALVTVAAAFVPTWRASRISPISALKYE